jgi:hypothetical protein
MFARAEKDRADRDMHLVHESGLEVLPDCGDTAAEPNVLTLRGVSCQP